MASLTNPYAVSPIGEALARLGQTLTSGPTQAQRIKGAEEALALRREREGITSLADLFGGGPNLDRAAISRAAILGGVSPDDVSGMDLYRTANAFGAADPRTDASARGAGSAFSTTAQAFNIDQGNAMTRAANTLAESRRQFDQKPLAAVVDGAFRFVPTSEATGPNVSPVVSNTEQQGRLLGLNWDNLGSLDPAQQAALGAQPTAGAKPDNYMTPDGRNLLSADGLTSTTGEPIPEGSRRVSAQMSGTPADFDGPTTANTTYFQRQVAAATETLGILQSTRQALEAVPDWSLGVSGSLNAAIAGASTAAQNIAEGMGFSAPSDAIASFEQQIIADAERRGQVPRLLSREIRPDRVELDTLYILLTYSVASTLFGQGGRDLSNEDVKRSETAVGDPGSFWQNKPTLSRKLDTLERQIAAQRDYSASILTGTPIGTPVAPRPVTPRPASPQPATPPAPVDPRFGDAFGGGQQGTAAGFGQPQQVRTEAEYNALPPGAEYIDPNGVRRRKGG